MPRRDTWRVDQLKPNPQQAAFFRPVSAERVAELVEDIRTNGLREPPAILPDGTILSGHTRIAALKLLGWKKVKVDVYDDLADDPQAAEQFFIKENSLRRQLSPLEQARCAKRLMELAAVKKPGQKLSDSQQTRLAEKTRDVVGQELGLSGRQVARLIRVLETPLDVQWAYEAGQLPIVDAGKVAGLPTPLQAEIAREIRQRGTEHAREIVRRHFAQRSSPGSRQKALDRFLCKLRNELPHLAGHEAELRVHGEQDLELLRLARDVLGKLQQQARTRRRQFERKFARICRSVESGHGSADSAHG